MPQGEDIGFEERSYSVTEGLLDYKDRKVLYIDSQASDVTFCDRTYASHLGSINVKGYVVRWRCGTNENGEVLTEIETIDDDNERREIGNLLRENCNISTVNFYY